MRQTHSGDTLVRTLTVAAMRQTHSGDTLVRTLSVAAMRQTHSGYIPFSSPAVADALTVELGAYATLEDGRGGEGYGHEDSGYANCKQFYSFSSSV